MVVMDGLSFARKEHCDFLRLGAASEQMGEGLNTLRHILLSGR